jgi:hypothetical protein
MPQLDTTSEIDIRSHLENEKLCYNIEAPNHEGGQVEICLNKGQRKIWNKINDAFNSINNERQLEV